MFKICALVGNKVSNQLKWYCVDGTMRTIEEIAYTKNVSEELAQLWIESCYHKADALDVLRVAHERFREVAVKWEVVEYHPGTSIQNILRRH